ncbi:hypothetical protein GOBAR_DD08159 [Gossypium barbadense]|nr:hypothetical protein GOBAR_DD08159 [Gossypium barbadense]
MMNSMERESSDEGEPAKCLTKKVCIRETEGDTDVAMDSALITEKPLLWKDRLMRTGLQAKGQTTTTNDISNEGEFELSETDVMRSSVNGIPSISFSEWVNQILINNMPHIMLIKLLGRSTGTLDYLWAVPNRPTMVHGFQHNTTLLTYGHGVDSVSWIARAHVQRRILREIGKLVGKVAKLYFNMGNGVKGRFARMTKSGDQDSRPTNNLRFHALETLVEVEGIQEQGTGLGNETGQRKRGPEVSLIMKEEVMVSTKKGVLDLSRHSAVAFKENIWLSSSTGSPASRLGVVGH